MGKTIQYTIITNKEYSFPNCINKLPPILKRLANMKYTLLTGQIQKSKNHD